MSDTVSHGLEWSKHKYIRKEGDRYIYPEDLEKEAKSSSANRSTSKLSSEGKEMWNYVKEDITKEKNEAIDAAKAEREKRIEELRQKAAATTEHVNKQLKHIAELIADQRSDRLRQIESQRKVRVAALENRTIPEGLSGSQREEVEKSRARELQSINSQAEKDKARVRSTTSPLTEIAKQQRETTALELRTAIDAAKTAFEQKKAGIDKDYEEVYQEEYERILATYPQIKRGKSGKSGASSSSASSTASKSKKGHKDVMSRYKSR